MLCVIEHLSRDYVFTTCGTVALYCTFKGRTHSRPESLGALAAIHNKTIYACSDPGDQDGSRWARIFFETARKTSVVTDGVTVTPQRDIVH